MARSSQECICNYCGRSFARKYNVLNHIKNCHVSTSCFCEICEQKFSSPIGLKMHLMRGHNRFKEGKPECDLCGKIFTRKESLICHLQTKHSIGKNTLEKSCEVCNKKFTNVKNLKAHVKKLHNSNLEHPACDECNKVFRNKELLLAHIQTVHKVSAKDIYRCSLCEKVCSSQRNLKRHLLVFHGVNEEYKCDVCSETFGSESGMRRHAKTAHNIDLLKEFVCEHCSRVFPQLAFLNSHISLHHKQDSLNPQNYSCECGKVFDSEPSLRQHIKSDHEFDVFYSYCKNSLLRTLPIGGEKAKTSSSGHDCEICQEHLPSLYDLRNHMKANHDLQLSVETCNVCFTRFYSKQAMNRHQKVCFPPNNAVQCSLCDKLFTAKSSLNLHMKVFHCEKQNSFASESGNDSDTAKDVDEAPKDLKCRYCDRVFDTKGNVQRHIAYVHLCTQRYSCLECESHFKERRNLRKHIRIKHPHSTTFPQCHFCQKRFESAKMCKTHLKQVHSFDTNTFPCEICSASYSTNDSLTLHMRTKHTEIEELFKCESCSIVFKGYETFEKHNQKCQESTLITPESAPRCVICMKDFCTEKSLKRHIKTFHEGFDPSELAAIGFSKRLFIVDCKDCMKSFTDDDLYGKYLKNKHISEEIIFKCPTCAETYNVIEFAVQRYKITTKARKRKQPCNESDDEEETCGLQEEPGCSNNRFH